MIENPCLKCKWYIHKNSGRESACSIAEYRNDGYGTFYVGPRCKHDKRIEDLPDKFKERK